MAKSLIIVEGENDKKFIHSLAYSHGFAVADEVIRFAGDKDSAKAELKVELKSTHLYNKVSVILDADDKPEGTWQSILGILERSGKYKVKQNMPIPSGGVIIEPIDVHDIPVGIWIMPDNRKTGMLEDFVASLIKEDDRIFCKAKEIVAELDRDRDDYKNLFKHVHISKATVYTWLAWRNSPEQTMEQAVKKNVFDELKMQSDNCMSFIDWLRKVV